MKVFRLSKWAFN